MRYTKLDLTWSIWSDRPMVLSMIGIGKMLVGLLFVLAIEFSFAGEYVIEEGDGLAVCKAYRDNLNALKPNLPIGCGGRNVRAPNSEISLPDWKSVQTENNFPELLPKIATFLWKRDANPAYYYDSNVALVEYATKKQRDNAYRNYLRHQHVGGRMFGSPFAIVDIDNDGKPDNIYLDKLCGLESAILLVLNDDKSNIDISRTSQVLRHQGWKSQGKPEYRKAFPGESVLGQPSELESKNLKITEDALHFVNYNVFMYYGRSYFDMWWSQSADYMGRPAYGAGKLRVFTIEDSKVGEVCSYRFEGAPK